MHAVMESYIKGIYIHKIGIDFCCTVKQLKGSYRMALKFYMEFNFTVLRLVAEP